MSKTQDGFLGKVSKGIKKSIYDDEPDAASGKLIIERLQSLAGTATPGQSKKTVERTPDAVGAVNAQGVVMFNYVSPRHRFCGVSQALMSHLEAVLRADGHAEARLVSTTTAHLFYLDRGWMDDGAPEIDGFSTSYPMRKSL